MQASGGDVPSFVTPDVRRARRVISGVLLATGQPSGGDLARANEAMSALGWPALNANDFVVETPESLAETVPIELRVALLDVLYVLAGDEPIRKRIADAYAGLWQAELVEAEAAHQESAGSINRGSPLARWLIGELPRHHIGRGAKENDMIERGPYRGGEGGETQRAPTERTPLRRKVEQIRAEYLQVVAAVERVSRRSVPVVHRPVVPEAATLISDPARAAVELGWKARRSDLDDIVREAWTASTY